MMSIGARSRVESEKKCFLEPPEMLLLPVTPLAMV